MQRTNILRQSFLLCMCERKFSEGEFYEKKFSERKFCHRYTFRIQVVLQEV